MSEAERLRQAIRDHRRYNRQREAILEYRHGGPLGIEDSAASRLEHAMRVNERLWAMLNDEEQ